MLAEVWDGRFVSEATLSTAVKSARRALGDSGEAQTWIETVRGRGFRFRGAVSVEVPARPATAAGARRRGARRRRAQRALDRGAAVRAARRRRAPSRGSRTRLPHEVIIALARLHWLFVIARGSVVPLPRAGGRHRDGRTDVRGALLPDRDARDASPGGWRSGSSSRRPRPAAWSGASGSRGRSTTCTRCAPTSSAASPRRSRCRSSCTRRSARTTARRKTSTPGRPSTSA